MEVLQIKPTEAEIRHTLLNDIRGKQNMMNCSSIPESTSAQRRTIEKADSIETRCRRLVKKEVRLQVRTGSNR